MVFAPNDMAGQPPSIVTYKNINKKIYRVVVFKQILHLFSRFLWCDRPRFVMSMATQWIRILLSGTTFKETFYSLTTALQPLTLQLAEPWQIFTQLSSKLYPCKNVKFKFRNSTYARTQSWASFKLLHCGYVNCDNQGDHTYEFVKSRPKRRPTHFCQNQQTTCTVEKKLPKKFGLRTSEIFTKLF
jgi:hypothetical protein